MKVNPSAQAKSKFWHHQYVSLSTLVKDFAPVMAAVASAVSAFAALRTAKKTSNAAKDSNHALAAALRPAFAPRMLTQLDSRVDGREVIQILNTAAFPAIDIIVNARTIDGQHLAGHSYGRAPGMLPNVLADESKALKFLVPLASLTEAQPRQEFYLTIRF